jgi:hypothetical protein
MKKQLKYVSRSHIAICKAALQNMHSLLEIEYFDHWAAS